MYEYTLGNHFKFGYDGTNNYQDRSSERQIFSFEYGKTLVENLNWRQANELAARQIYDRKSGEIFILLSGGMDSEICFRSFYDQKLPVRTISLRFLDIDQAEEMSYIQKSIAKYGITNHEFVDVDIKHMIFSQIFNEIADATRCVSPIVILHLWLANQLSGTPVIAQGEVHLKKEVPDDYVPGVSEYLPSDWYLVESERLCAIYKNFILKTTPAIPGFFQYNPEQIYSYIINNPLLQQLVQNQIHGKLGTRTSKNIIAHQFYPDVELREKRHGWESIQEYHDQIRSDLAKKYPHSDQIATIKLSHLISMLKGDFP